MPMMVRFSTGDGAWLAPVESVLGVHAATTVRAVPDPAPGIVGIIDRDGATHPVTGALGQGSDYVLLVGDGDDAVGILTDQVCDVTAIDARTLRPRPAGQRRAYVDATHGAGRDLAFVLDTAELIRAVLQRTETDDA